MDSLISQPEAKKTDLETSEFAKDVEDVANGNNEGAKENGKVEATEENLEEDVRLIDSKENTEANVESTGDESIQNKNGEETTASDINQSKEESETNNQDIVESSVNNLEKDAEIQTKIYAETEKIDQDTVESTKKDFSDAEEPETEKSCQDNVDLSKNNNFEKDFSDTEVETEKSGQDLPKSNVLEKDFTGTEIESEKGGQEKVELAKNHEKDSNSHNDDAGETIEVEDCVAEPDLPMFDDNENENHMETGDDNENENHMETEDSPLDYCEIVSDKDDNLETPQEQEHPQGNNSDGEEIIRNFLPAAPSGSKRKSKKPNDKKKSEVVQTISDDSGTESDSSTENVNVNELKESIANLLGKLKPKELSKEDEELKQYNYRICHVQFSRLHCTACNKHMGSALSRQKDRYIHPQLKVLMCKTCYNFYTSGDFEKDEDGSELYCRWCGQGGKVICCSECAYVFCTKCITRNCGTKRLQQIKSVDDWLCFACNPNPLQKYQVQCTALIEYLRDEMTRLNGLDLDNTNLYRMDYSNCCSRRKRKSKDTDFSIEEELSVVKKARTSRAKFNTTRPILNTQEQEEVVCAPDLLSFMSEDDVSMNVDDVTIEKPAYTRCSPPPLQPRPSATVLPTLPLLNNYRFVTPVILPKNAMLVQNPARNTVIVQTAVPKPKPALVHNPASAAKTKGKQIILNTTLKNPITPNNIGNLTSSVEKVSTHKITLKTPNQTLPKLVPGLKYEWFDSASKSSLDIQSKLSCSIAELSVEKHRASTMEDLASIHNRFQEVLSKSINAMIQIRRTLRNDFLASLNNLKFIKNVQEPKDDDDDDVVFVDSTAPAQAALNDEHHGPYLKVRSVSQLLNVPSECITIPDEVIEKISENKKEEDAAKKVEEQENSDENSFDMSNDSNKENVESFTSNPIEIDDDEKESVEEVPSKEDNEEPQEVDAEKPESENLEPTQESQKAIFESKIKKLVNDNLKYNVNGISVKELKRMLSARVYLSKNYKPKKRNQN